MNNESKSDRQLLLEIHREVAINGERLAHHLENTCPRHEGVMSDCVKDGQALKQDRAKIYGIAIALPLIMSLLGYIWVTQIAMAKLETQLAVMSEKIQKGNHP